MTARTYATPQAFKQALEQTLRDTSSTGADFGRRRQLIVFERFLARIVQTIGDAATLKGGLVLEIRLERARTTKDVDLRLLGSSENVIERLQAAGRLDLGDFMTFEIQPDAHHPDIQNDGMKYDGLRFRAECKLGGKLYGQRFGVDVAFGDPILGPPDEAVTADLLSFAGIAPPTLRLYPVETHIAEKLHAYTMPRQRLNTRVKDLPDLALLATARALDAKKLREALQLTFSFRDTHPLPAALPAPPAAWEAPYAEMAAEDSLEWTTLTEVEVAVRAFLDPILRGAPVTKWDRRAWR